MCSKWLLTVMISWPRPLVVSVVEEAGLVSLRTVAAARLPLSRLEYRQLLGGPPAVMVYHIYL